MTRVLTKNGNHMQAGGGGSLHFASVFPGRSSGCKPCWCSVENVGMNPGILKNKYQRDGFPLGSFHFSLFGRSARNFGPEAPRRKIGRPNSGAITPHTSQFWGPEAPQKNESPEFSLPSRSQKLPGPMIFTIINLTPQVGGVKGKQPHFPTLT